MRSQLLLIALACVAALRGEELALHLDPARTTVNFALPATLHTVHGSFKLKRGAVRFDPATGRISGEVAIDATSGNSDNESRDKRMHKDVLASGRYPEIVFTPDRVDGAVAATGGSRVQVHGTFRIHGADHEMVIPVDVHMAAGQATATARFAIPYVKWGMKNPSNLLLHVGDQVEIVASTVAVP